MSRRMVTVVGLAVAVAVGATTSFAARLVQAPAGAPVVAAIQPPEPPEPPRPPRGDNREQPGQRPGEAMPRVMVGGGGAQMTASGKFVYILRGDEIMQFEGTTLEFIKKVKLPPPERQQRPARDEERRPPPNEPNPPLARGADADAKSTLDQFTQAKPDAKALAFYSLDWSPSLKEAMVRAKQERRPVFLIANTNITAGCNFYTGHT